MTRTLKATCLIAFGFSAMAVSAAPAPGITVDFSKPIGKLRAINGVNNGPFVASSWVADMVPLHKAAGFSSVRLHDCNWPNPNVVDIPAIFPLFHADADDPKNYIFPPTDRYLAPIVANGSDIVYRLGVSIEHNTDYHTYPPEDYEKWAKICINIIRHYNDGWANGFHYNIKHFEIWNEPDLGPRMWRGTPGQYFDLYRVASTALKAYSPELMVGGPGVARLNSKFTRDFLGYCRDNKLPLDFFSWHIYPPTIMHLMAATRDARALMDEYGFQKSQSFLTEYRSRPGRALEVWKPSNPPGSVRKARELDGNNDAASFTASALLQMQDSPVDMAHFYSADMGPLGIFDEFGEPNKVYFAFLAFNQFLQTPDRVAVAGATGNNELTVGAGLAADHQTGGLLVSNYLAKQKATLSLQNLPWKGETLAEIWRIDEKNDYQRTGEVILKDPENSVLELDCPPHTILFVRISPKQP